MKKVPLSVERTKAPAKTKAKTTPSYYLRLGGLAIFVVRNPSKGPTFVDILFPNAESGLFADAAIPSHVPQIQPVNGKPECLNNRAVLITCGTGGVTISGGAARPAGSINELNASSFGWLPRLAELAPPGKLVPDIIPDETKLAIPSDLAGFVRLVGAYCVLSNGGFAAAGPLKTRLQTFRTRVGMRNLAFAESALLTLWDTPTVEQFNRAGDPVTAPALPFSTVIDKDNPAMLSNESTKTGNFTSDFTLYSRALQDFPEFPSMISESWSEHWPNGVRAPLRGGRTSGRPVCPPVVGEWP